MPDRVFIRGSGMAAVCCAQLLCTAGVDCVLSQPEKRKSNFILLSESSQSLLGKLFSDRNLLAGYPRIRQRIVRWGAAADTIPMPHSALVVSEDDLLNRLWAQIGVSSTAMENSDCWEIIAGLDMQRPRREQACGNQVAATYEARLRNDAPDETCWMESVEHGWLFLFSVGQDAARLIVVGRDAAALLAESRLVAGVLEDWSGVPVTFSSYPRIFLPLCGSGWTACGSAAMTYDPICGEGTGTAVREAILAAALVRATSQGYAEEELLAHYSSRLMRGFLRHLNQCAYFYETGGKSEFWSTALAHIREGLAWGQQQPMAAPRFRLVDYSLEPVENDVSDLNLLGPAAGR